MRVISDGQHGICRGARRAQANVKQPGRHTYCPGASRVQHVCQAEATALAPANPTPRGSAPASKHPSSRAVSQALSKWLALAQRARSHTRIHGALADLRHLPQHDVASATPEVLVGLLALLKARATLQERGMPACLAQFGNACRRHSGLVSAWQTHPGLPSVFDAAVGRSVANAHTFSNATKVSELAVAQAASGRHHPAFWAALEEHNAPASLRGREVANVLHSAAVLQGRFKAPAPSAALLEALVAAAGNTAAAMAPQAVANTAWALSKLKPPAPAPPPVLPEAFISAMAPALAGMTAQGVSNTLYALGELRQAPQGGLKGAAFAAAAAVAPAMSPQSASNTLYALAKMALHPSKALAAALDAAVVRGAPGLQAQHVANVLYSYAVLDTPPQEAVCAALRFALLRVAPHMTPQAVGNSLWALAVLRCSGGGDSAVADTAALRALWARAGDLGASSFAERNLQQVHQANVILQSEGLDDGLEGAASVLQASSAVCCRTAELQGACTGSDVAGAVCAAVRAVVADSREAVSVEMEAVVGDGSRTVDILLVQGSHKVAMEIDGATHRCTSPDGSRSWPSPGTRLRNTTLGKWGYAVLPFPVRSGEDLASFDSDANREVLQGKLRDAHLEL